MVEAVRILRWLRAKLPASKSAEPDQARAERDGRAPVYVPAKRGNPPRRGGGDGSARG